MCNFGEILAIDNNCFVGGVDELKMPQGGGVDSISNKIVRVVQERGDDVRDAGARSDRDSVYR